MRYSLFLLVSWLFLTPTVTNAADANGYTAKYEKPIGTPPPCSAIISSVSDANWNKLNDSSYRVICIEPGDYSSRGTITLTASGSANNERWLRYYRSSDSNITPWRQSISEKTKVKRLLFDGANHWIVDRLTIDGNGTNEETLKFSDGTGAKNNIVNRVLVENAGNHLVAISGPNNDANTIQNSVLRNCVVAPGLDSSAVSISGNALDTRIVNNEIYNCVKGIYVSEHGAAGTIIENNDIYLNPDRRTDCNGSFTASGTCAAGEVLIGMKSGGTPSSIVRIVHNRLWGMRAADTLVCCAGGGAQGDAVGLDSNGAGANPSTQGTKYTLVQNNIIMDSQHGITSYWSGVRNNSIIGNILYNIRRYSSRFQSYAFATEDGYNSSSEWYLNTVIDSDAWINYGGAPNNDVRCNVAVNSGGAVSSTGTGTQVSNNAFYGTAGMATDNSVNTITRALAADSKNSSFCFTRKLLTGSEQFCIPNARASTESPHFQACASDIGTRAGIGVNNATP